MYSIQEQFKTDALAQINGRVRDAQAIAGSLLDLSREIGVLNVRTSKASAEQFAGAVRQLLEASNPGEFLQRAASVMQPDMQLWTSYIEQLRTITAKAGVPVTTTLSASAAALLAPQAAPGVTWPKPEATPQAPVAEAAPASASAPAADDAAVPEQMQLEAAFEPAPDLPPPAAVPYATAIEESSAEAAPASAAIAPETVEAIKEVAEAMTGAHKAPPAVMAASALPPDEEAAPEISVVRKAAVTRGERKPVAPPAKKPATPARPASGRARKG